MLNYPFRSRHGELYTIVLTFSFSEQLQFNASLRQLFLMYDKMLCTVTPSSSGRMLTLAILLSQEGRDRETRRGGYVQ